MRRNILSIFINSKQICKTWLHLVYFFEHRLKTNHRCLINVYIYIFLLLLLCMVSYFRQT